MCGIIRAYQYSRPDAFETIDKLLLLMVPMSVGLVSHTVVHDNTSGHLHVVVHGED